MIENLLNHCVWLLSLLKIDESEIVFFMERLRNFLVRYVLAAVHWVRR